MLKDTDVSVRLSLPFLLEGIDNMFIMTKLKRRKDYFVTVWVRTLGNFLIFGSIISLLITFWPILTAEIKYRFDGVLGVKFGVSEDNTKAKTEVLDLGITPSPEVGFRSLLDDQTATTFSTIVPKSTSFGVVVEKIGANAVVLPNIDPSNRTQYEKALKQGIAHAKGSVYPGQKGVSFLFSHSTQNVWDVPRYNAIFYLLRELEVGDRIITYFNNVRYDYVVDDKVVVDANDTSYYNLDTQEPLLIMQTCDPPGTTWKRLLVIAKLANPDGAKVPERL